MTGLRVAFIGGRGVGGKYSGIETIYEQVAPRLARRGHEVTIYCRSYFTPVGFDMSPVRLVRLGSFRSKHIDTPLHSARSTLHALFSRHNVVHYHALGSALLAWIPRLRGTATVTTVHALDWQRAKWGVVARKVLQLGEWASVAASNRATSVSRHLAEHLEQKYGRPVRYVPNGVDPVEVPPPDRLLRLGLEPGRFFLFAGRLSPEKGCHTLIRAHRELGTDMPLVLAGGALEPRYEAALRAEAGPGVVFAGYLDSASLAELYAHAYLFVLPSHIEGLSMAILEAMSYGCPVAASDLPENRELTDDVAFVFPSGDVAALAGLMDELLRDPERVRAAGRGGRVKVQREYSWDRVVDQLEELYVELLAERGLELALVRAMAGKPAAGAVGPAQVGVPAAGDRPRLGGP